MQLHRTSSLWAGGMQRCSKRQYAALRPATRKRQQLAVTASAGETRRTWGSGWGRKQRHDNVKQQQQQQEQAQQQVPKEPAQQNLSKEDYAEVYDSIANSIHQSFLQNGIFGCCQPASLLFYEAVKQVNTSADPQFVLGYIVVPEPSPGGPDVCARHIWIQLDGKNYDIGQTVAVAMLQQRHGPNVPLPKYGLYKPAEAVYVGWDMARFSQELKARVTTEEQDAAMVQQFESESGRQLYWSGSPPQLLAEREKILARKWL